MQSCPWPLACPRPPALLRIDIYIRRCSDCNNAHVRHTVKGPPCYYPLLPHLWQASLRTSFINSVSSRNVASGQV
jgi:hypothetical protein